MGSAGEDILSHYKAPVFERRLLFYAPLNIDKAAVKRYPADSFNKTHKAVLNCCSRFMWHFNCTQLEQQHLLSPTQVI